MTITVERRADLSDERLDALFWQEEARRKSLDDLARLRKEARAEIERLIGFLDASDDYTSTELEAAIDDEPCDEDELDVLLGSADNMMNQEHGWGAKGGESGDLESDGNCDDEPSLGAPECHPNPYNSLTHCSQENW